MPRFAPMVQSVIAICAIWFALIGPSLSVDSPYIVTETIPEANELPLINKAPAKYGGLLGNLFAGQHEFPWLVDIKVKYLWKLNAVGNLLTSFHVLTTCRTIANYEKYIPTDEGTQITYYEGPGSMRVSFGSTYLNEIDRASFIYSDPDSDKKMVGVRIPSYVTLHPNCNHGRSFANDVAVIGLSRPIELMPPYVALAPMYRSPSAAIIPDIVDWVDVTTNLICWVAAWGRNYTNAPNPMTLDHKVKIRTYAFPNMTRCLNIWSLLCPDTFADRDICKDNTPIEKPHSGLICMETRSPVGAVCDTNKGGPIVCDGLVFGMVARAVPITYCNSTDPQPFVAVNLHAIETGDPKLYSGAMIEYNKNGSAPHFESDNVILYTRNGCLERMSIVGLPVLMIFFLLTMSVLGQVQ